VALAQAAGAEAIAPPPGEVAQGSTLQFSLSIGDFTASIDDRPAYVNFGYPTQCKPLYTFDAIWSEALSPPPRPHLEITGDLAGPPGTFDFSVPVGASSGFVFFVVATLVAPCGAASFYRASAHFGPYSVASAPAPPPPPGGSTPVPQTPPVPQAPPASPAGPVPPTPAAPAAATGIRTCPVRIDGRRVEVTLKGAASCGDAVAIARGRLAGWTCAAPPLSSVRRYVICSRGGAWGVALPAAGGACAPVTFAGRRYRVFGARVLCSLARATALRMLQRRQPYVFEFVAAGLGPRWTCRIAGRGADERGSCFKRVEERWMVYLPAA